MARRSLLGQEDVPKEVAQGCVRDAYWTGVYFSLGWRAGL